MVTTFIGVRIGREQKSFLRELQKRIGAKSFSDAIRYCIDFVKLVSEGKLNIMISAEMLISLPFTEMLRSWGSTSGSCRICQVRE